MDLSIIKEIRKKRGLSQQMLGDKLGVSGAYIQQIESNKKNPSIKTLQKISEALDIPLFTLTGNISPEDALKSIYIDDKLDIKTMNDVFLDVITPDIVALINEIMDRFHYDIDIRSNTVHISHKSGLCDDIEITSQDYLNFSKNVYWALESFINHLTTLNKI